MNGKAYVRLSKVMSFLLRHGPDRVGLELDARGMIPIPALLKALHRRQDLNWVTVEDIEHVVAISDKQRFQLEGERIGARYGHNRRLQEIDPGEPVEPPALLYHGTPRHAVSVILRDGLKPQNRQFVHLSASLDTALLVGRRRDARPAILQIRARHANEDGIEFYAPTGEIYLARHIPPEYIGLEA